MSAISPSPFVRFWHPENAPDLFNGVQLVPEKDLAEQVSDVLLFLSSSHIYEASRVDDHVDFQKWEPDAILHWIAFVIAWTLWLPLTLLGIVIVQFSASHAALYQTAHAKCWEDQLYEVLREVVSPNLALVQNEKLKTVFEEAISCSYLFEILLREIDSLPDPDFHIPVLLDCFFDFGRSRLLFKLLEKLPADQLAHYMAHCLPKNPIRARQQSLLKEYCFNPISDDSAKRESYIVAGFMGIMEAAAKQPAGGLRTPTDTVVFDRTSMGDGRSVDDLYKWVSQIQGNVDFVKKHKDVIIDQIGRNAPDHQQLINVIHRLTEVPLRPI